MPRLVGAPAVASSGDGRLEVFVFSVDGALWHLSQTRVGGGLTEWSGWTLRGGSWPGGSWPATVVPSADGRLELFVAADGLQHAWQAAWSSNGWSGWVSHGPPPPTIPGADFAGPGVAPHPDGRLALFVANGQLWRLEQTAPSNGWSGWLPHGAPAGVLVTGPVAAIRSPDGRIEVFVVDTGGSMWNLHQTSAGGPWSGWNAFGSAGGGLDGRPALAANAEGRLELFVRGKDGVMWRRSQTQVGGTEWSDWVSIGIGLTDISVALLDHPAVAVHPDGRLDVFMTGGAHPHWVSDRAMWQALQREVGGGLGGFDWVEQHRPEPSSLDTIHFGGAAPAVGNNGDGRMELFAVGADGELWHTSFEGVRNSGMFQSEFVSHGHPAGPDVFTTVPDVRQLRPTAASAAVRAAHLIPKFTGQTSGNAWVDTQSPQPGTLVEPDSTVTMHLRSGPIL
jgi:hypothetical protein